MYTIFVKDLNLNHVYEIPGLSMSFDQELNKGANSTISFDYHTLSRFLAPMNKDVLFLFTAGKRELWIEKDGDVVYSGRVSDFEQMDGRDGTSKLQIATVDLLTLLSRRRTAAYRFDEDDAGEIGWKYIDYTQNVDPPYSDLGITKGTVEPSVTRQRTQRFGNIRQELTQLSNEALKNGFDFEINNLKQYNTFFPTKGEERPNLVLEYNKNILDYKFKRPLLMSLANRVHVLGEGFNDDRVTSTRTSDPTFREAFGLLEDILSEPDTKEIENLEDKGDRFLEEKQAPKDQLTISHFDDDPDIRDYDLGDSLPVTIPKIGYDLEFKRVYRRTVFVDENGLAIVTNVMR